MGAGRRMVASTVVLMAGVVCGIGVMPSHSSSDNLAFRSVCTPRPGAAACNASQLATPNGTAPAKATPTSSGWTARDLEAAYGVSNLVGSGGSGRLISLVDAYDDPTVESDMNAYRAAYGLPLCTSASGCFTKLNQDGDPQPLPSADTTGGWGVETTLDLDMLSALCPKCHITLVEANDEQLSSLFQAEQAAMAVSPSAVSNSWGSAEFAGEQNYDSWFTPPDPKTLVLFSVGDLGYAPGPEYPATSPNVVSVGGTVLNHAKGSSGWVQSVWSGTQSGCSLYEPKPAWQSPLVPSCDHRMAADVSAVATNVAVYDTYLRPGWMTASGTSISVAVIAALETLAGGSVTSPAKLYSTSGAGFFDVKAGGDGNCGSSGDPTYALCHAVGGYDAPTGRGAPYGISGLTAH